MKIPYKWLVELSGTTWKAEELAERLTLCGTACEYVEPADRYMHKVIVGEITAINSIKGADKIRLATVSLGDNTMDVVCGAPNIEVGQKVPVATLGAELAGDIVIKKAKIRGIESQAMICSERELGLSDDHSGILVLPDDSKPGTPIADLLDYTGDFELTFELTPNRPDSMSAIGIARDIAALTSQPVKKPDVTVTESGESAADYISVAIDDVDACPRYAARMIKNVRIGPSPWWLKKKLILSGIRPISNIVDITNYVMLETGQPLHAFDYNRFGSKEVVVRRGKEGEKFTTLDGVEHSLTSEVLMITNGKVSVAAGGVMGGLTSEVEDDTTDVLLEAAYFNASVTRKSRKKLGFVTESSQRFEKGCDPNIIEYAINRAASLMADLAGGEVLKGIVDCYPASIEPLILDFRVKRCADILGITVPTDTIKQIFTDLEFKVTGDESVLKVTVPTFRPDIEREIDLIEEIARVYGLDNIPDAITNIGPLYTPNHYQDVFNNATKTILTAAGFDEIVNHGLADDKLASLLFPNRPQLKISNPVSAELNIMRNSLIQSALIAMRYNISHRAIDLAVFELGTWYLPPDENDFWSERDALVLAVTGNTPHTWRENARPFDFYDITGALEQLAHHFDWGKITYKPNPVPFFDQSISFTVSINDQDIGIIGKMNAAVARKFDIKQDVYVAELDIHALREQKYETRQFKSLPVFPAAPRDLAFIIDQSVKAGDIVHEVISAAGELAESVDIFDVYTGKQIAEGKKSLAIAINYRSNKGSLESSQVEESQAKVISMLKQKFNAEVRDK